MASNLQRFLELWTDAKLNKYSLIPAKKTLLKERRPRLLWASHGIPFNTHPYVAPIIGYACSWRRKSKTVLLLMMLPSSKLKLGMMGPLAASEIQFLVHQFLSSCITYSVWISLVHFIFLIAWNMIHGLQVIMQELGYKAGSGITKDMSRDSKTSLKGFILGCSSSLFLVERWVSIKFVFNVSSVTRRQANPLGSSEGFKGIQEAALLVQAYLKHLKAAAFQQNLIHWFRFDGFASVCMWLLKKKHSNHHHHRSLCNRCISNVAAWC